MITRLYIHYRWLRRKMSRSHWTATLLGIRPPAGYTDEPGLIMLQIDGLSRKQMEKAMSKGNLPFLSHLLRKRHYELSTFYSGLPSTTPAVQAEIFYGVKAAVPAFEFLDRESGRIFRMYDAKASAEIENQLQLKNPQPLLSGGCAYSDIYRAGSSDSRYCAQDMEPDEILKRINVLKGMVLVVAYFSKILRIAFLAVLEFVIAFVDFFKGLYQHQDFLIEILFVPIRILVCILLREMVTFRVIMDIESGVRVIHANFLGYDEQAHRRGPDSAFAHWTLKGIDRAIRDIHRAAGRTSYRDYEFIIHSDHGQERAEPYSVRHGHELHEALVKVFSKGPLTGREIWHGWITGKLKNSIAKWRASFESKLNPQGSVAPPEPMEQIIVTAMGPLGHIYLPEKIDPSEMKNYASELVMSAGIPLVLIREKNGLVVARNPEGFFQMPRDKTHVLGSDHPFLDEVAIDLVELCNQPNAGDFVISGWNPRASPMSFPQENGAHGGPGIEETSGFVMLPQKAGMPRDRVRGTDLRMIASGLLQSNAGPSLPAPSRKRISDRADVLRVMTYNIHSCVGLDGKVRPDRVIGIINHFDPDIIAVQEVDCHRERSGRHDQSRLIAEHLGMAHVFHAMLEEENERYGIAIFARNPFKIVKAAHLTAADKLRFREARGAIWVKFEIEQFPPIHFVNTHFGLGARERKLQADELLGPDWLGSISDSEPAILCGDLNSGPYSSIARRFQGRFRDAQLALDNHKPRSTFASLAPLTRIDHVFLSHHFEVKAVMVPSFPTAVIASDHLPVCVDLRFRS